MEDTLMEEYLSRKHYVRRLPKLVAELTEGERENFFKLFSKGINKDNMITALGLCERTLKKREKENFSATQSN